VAVALFASTWMLLSPHPWSRWSILGSALILFTSYFQVQVSVASTTGTGHFTDLVQAALSKAEPVTLLQFYSSLQLLPKIAFVAVTVGVLTRFFVSHYIFRWRTWTVGAARHLGQEFDCIGAAGGRFSRPKAAPADCVRINALDEIGDREMLFECDNTHGGNLTNQDGVLSTKAPTLSSGA